MPHTTHDHQKERRDAKRYHPVDDDALAIIEKALLPDKCQNNACAKTDANGVFHDCAYPDCKMPREKT